MLIGLIVSGAAFFAGVFETVSSMLAVYLAAVWAEAFSKELTEVARRKFEVGRTTGRLRFFALDFLPFSLVFTFATSQGLHGPTVPRWFGVLDTIDGAALGLLIAGTAVTVAALLLSVLVQALQQVATHGQGP